MSKYSEKLERRREEAAREAAREAKAARHAAFEAEAAVPAHKAEVHEPVGEFAPAGDIPSRLVLELAAVLDGYDRAVAAADELMAVSAKGLTKNEALSIRNSLWAAREKLRRTRARATLFYLITKAEVANA